VASATIRTIGKRSSRSKEKAPGETPGANQNYSGDPEQIRTADLLLDRKIFPDLISRMI